MVFVQLIGRLRQSDARSPWPAKRDEISLLPLRIQERIAVQIKSSETRHVPQELNIVQQHSAIFFKIDYFLTERGHAVDSTAGRYPHFVKRLA